MTGPTGEELAHRPSDAGQEPLRPLTIVHLHQKTSLSTGSVQQMVQAVVGLRNRGHLAVAVTPPSAPLATLLEGHAVGHHTLPFRHYLDLRTVLGLRTLFRELRPDVVHVHKGLAHWLALVALLDDPGPALIVNRGVSFPLTFMNRGKYRARRTDRVITVCEAIREVICRSGKLPAEKIDVIYAGTDTARFDPRRVDGQSVREELGIANDAFVVFQSGTRAWKGWREVLDAVAELRSDLPETHLLIVGHDSDHHFEEIRRVIVQHGLEGRVHLLGYRDDIEHVIAAADVAVDASWEGTGITGTIREAMALGVPVIATDCGGNRELIASPSLGWLVPRRDHARLVGTLREVAGDPMTRERVSANALDLVRRELSAERRIDRLERLYEACATARQKLPAVRRANEASLPG